MTTAIGIYTALMLTLILFEIRSISKHFKFDKNELLRPGAYTMSKGSKYEN